MPAIKAAVYEVEGDLTLLGNDGKERPVAYFTVFASPDRFVYKYLDSLGSPISLELSGNRWEAVRNGKAMTWYETPATSVQTERNVKSISAITHHILWLYFDKMRRLQTPPVFETGLVSGSNVLFRSGTSVTLDESGLATFASWPLGFRMRARIHR